MHSVSRDTWILTCPGNDKDTKQQTDSVASIMVSTLENLKDAPQSHLPMKHWSALSFQNSYTSMLNNTRLQVILHLGVRKEGSIQEDVMHVLVNQDILNGHFFIHGSNLVTFPSFSICPQSHWKCSTLCSCIKLTIKPQIGLYQTTTTQISVLNY